MDLYKTCFYEAFNDEFMQYMAEFEYQLRQDLPDYDKKYEDEEEILEEYPNLRYIFENFEAVDLTLEEIKAFIKIILIRDDRSDVFMRNMFYKGFCEAFVLFKKANILK